MREILRTADPVLISFVETLLRQAGMSVHVLDRNMSALYGGVGQLQQRIVVDEDEWQRARRLLVDAQLEQWIVDPGEQ